MHQYRVSFDCPAKLTAIAVCKPVVQDDQVRQMLLGQLNKMIAAFSTAVCLNKLKAMKSQGRTVPGPIFAI